MESHRARAERVRAGGVSEAASTPSLVRRYAPGPLFGGLAVFASGPAILAFTVAYGFPDGQASQAAQVLSALGVGMGLLSSQVALLAGALAVFRSCQECCARCLEPLESRFLHFPLSWHDPMREACSSGYRDLIELAGRQEDLAGAEERTALEVEQCAGCRQSGRVTLSKVRWSAKSGRFHTFDEALPVRRTGWILGQLAGIAERRGEPAFTPRS